jgi:TRAP-type C4-dicarboxylate transport system substrate-binding protein
MKRIILVILTVLLVSAIIFGGCTKSAEEAPTTPTEPTKPTAKTIEWRFTSWDPPFFVCSEAAEEWGKELEEATGGRLKINFYWSESLIKKAGMFDAVTSGTANIGHISYADQPERFVLHQVLNLPFVFEIPEAIGPCALSLHNKYKELSDPLGPTKVLWMNVRGPSGELVTMDVQVRTMEDLKGLKLSNTSKWEVEAYKLLGATLVPIGITERYHALETGIVDGSIEDWVAAYIFKMYETTKYRTENIAMIGRYYPTLMHIESYNNLPEDVRRIFDELSDPEQRTKEDNEIYWEYVVWVQEAIKEHDKKVGNPQWYTLPDDERQRWMKAVVPLHDMWLEEVEAKGLPGKAILEDAIALGKK